MGISDGSNKVDVLQAPIPFTKVLMAYQGGGGGQFGDTTYTKVFVGGLAWETQRDTMRKYFEQFGEILEAVVITDKNTGRSKGYGFVTFRDPESARKACVDASPIIDGRRANCNLASLGAQRLRLSTPQHLGNRFKILGSYPSTFQSSGFHGTPTFNHPNPFTIHQGFPYHSYGYSPYTTDYATYSPNYYNAFGGSQVPVYAAPGMLTGPAALGPYVQFTQSTSPGYPQAMQVPQMMQLGQSAPSNINLNTLVPPYGASMLTIPAVAPTGAMTLAVPAPSPQAQHYQMHSALQAQFAVQGGGSLSEQPS